ncbi:MAG TPA: pitrilysin family protein [Bacteroidia bacterium]|nr:pitrilysin family protein [Bacteroidia bacterium]
MKRKIYLSAAAMCIVLASCTEKKSAEKKILPYPIHQKEMSNGLKVVTVEYDSPGIAAFYAVVRVGSRDEVEPGKSGFAHFFEHMMFRGTDKYSKDEYDVVLKTIGASANANTWLDRTVYHMTGNATMLDKMFELESDRFMNLKYPEGEFKAEAGAVKGEYTKNSSNPMEQLDELMNDSAFQSHTYKHTTMGFFNDVVDMPNQYDYSLEFFKRFYRPEYTTLLVVGDVKHADVEKLAEKYYGMWERGNFVSNITPEPAQTETKFCHVQNPGYPPVVQLNFKSPAYSDSDTGVFALDILSAVLFSERSELYKKLVVKEQKVRNLSGGAFFTCDPYLFQVTAMLRDAADMQYVKDEIIKAMEDAKTITVDSAFLIEAKSNFKYSFAMGMNSPDAIANNLSYFIWLTGDPESLNRAYAMYENITADDVKKTAQIYFNTTSLTVATISPDAASPFAGSTPMDAPKP